MTAGELFFLKKEEISLYLFYSFTWVKINYEFHALKKTQTKKIPSNNKNLAVSVHHKWDIFTCLEDTRIF